MNTSLLVTLIVVYLGSIFGIVAMSSVLMPDDRQPRFDDSDASGDDDLLPDARERRTG
jgi:hypothetical protein